MSATLTYTAKLKTRRQLEAIRDKYGYTESWGWWVDICPGKSLQLRDATEADIKRCYVREGDSKNPADWLCELFEGGALVARSAVATLTPNEVRAGGGQPA